jgi:predicted DNA-binding protein
MGRTSIRLTDAREQRFDDLQAATGAGSRTRALDVAAEHYLVDLKNKRELMNRLADGEQLAPHEIAGILSTPEVPIRFEASADVGPEK